MKRVYLAGAINGMEWRWYVIGKLPSDKFEVVNPMRRDYRGRESEHAAEIVEHDKMDIESCDALLVRAVTPSWGTAMEMFYGHQLGKRVVSFVGMSSVSPWVAQHSEVCLTMDEAIKKLSEEQR